MSKIEAKIVADSITKRGERLTTMMVTFPRYILAELNTHRMFSKNSASSRAIPFKKMVESVKNNPFIPIAWQKDHSGMQGTEYLENSNGISESTMANSVWLTGRDWAVKTAESLHSQDNGFSSVTKQLCNRLLEPFMWHTVLISATEWENFFKLRCPQYTLPDSTWNNINDKTVFKSRKELIDHCYENEFGLFSELDWLNWNKGQADIHMMALAEAIYDAYNENEPTELEDGEWHIPFGDEMDIDKLHSLIGNDLTKRTETRIKIAVARCARVSYTVVGEEGKKANYEDDLKLYDRLLSSGHMSPFEHIGKAMTDEEYNNHINGIGYNDYGGTFSSNQIFSEEAKGWSGNFRGFIQYRKTIE